MRIKKFNTIFAILFVLALFNCKAQSNPYNEDTILLTGTWVIEGETLSDKWVFESNGTLNEFADNQLDVSYNWEVVNSTNSGIKSKYLEIVNNNDSSDYYNYEISLLDEEKLVLIYQRKTNMGIGKPITYLKQ